MSFAGEDRPPLRSFVKPLLPANARFHNMIRPAQPTDVPVIVEFIRGLAAYEQLAHVCDADPGRLREHLFGESPVCHALIAEESDEPIGFALWFVSYSTFRTAPCLFLEDLFVVPAARGRGHGLALLKALAAIALERGYPRFDWMVLDWNVDAIEFYRRAGATLLTDWRVCRLEGEGLGALGAER